MVAALGTKKFKKRGTVEFAAGESKRERLPGNDLLPMIFLDVEGNLVLTGGSSDPAAVEDAPLTLVQLIKIFLAGKEVRRISGQDAFWAAYLRSGVLSKKSTFTFSGAGTYAFKFQIPIDFAAIGSLLPYKSILRTAPELQPEIEVTWGTTANLATGGDRALSFTNVSARLMVKFETGNVRPELFRTVVSLRKTISAASSELTQDLVFAKGLEYRGIYLKAILAGVRDDNVVNNVVLRAGEDDHIVDAPWTALKNETQRSLKLDQATYPAGVVYIDFDENKRWKELLDTTEFGSLQLEFDVDAPSGTTHIEIVPDYVRRVAA